MPTAAADDGAASRRGGSSSFQPARGNVGRPTVDAAFLNRLEKHYIGSVDHYLTEAGSKGSGSHAYDIDTVLVAIGVLPSSLFLGFNECLQLEASMVQNNKQKNKVLLAKRSGETKKDLSATEETTHAEKVKESKQEEQEEQVNIKLTTSLQMPLPDLKNQALEKLMDLALFDGILKLQRRMHTPGTIASANAIATASGLSVDTALSVSSLRDWKNNVSRRITGTNGFVFLKKKKDSLPCQSEIDNHNHFVIFTFSRYWC